MNLFKLVGSIFVDNEEANKSISKTDSNAESLAQKFVKGATTAAKWGAAITTAAVGMAATAGAAIVKVAEDTREYRSEIGKLETAFESSDHSAEVAKKTYKELQAILGETEQSVEAASHLAELCDTEEQLAKWTNICTGVYGKFGVSLPIEGLTEAANETAKTGALTGGLADALNWAGVNEDKFQEKLDKCSNEQQRQALITETLNQLYSESADLYRENNKEIIDANRVQEKLNDTMAKIGGTVEPVITKVKLVGVTLLEKATPAIVGFSEKVDVMAETFLKGQDPVQGLINKAQDLRGWFENVGSYTEKRLQPILVDLNSRFTIVKDAIGPLIDKGIEYVTSGELVEDVTMRIKDAVNFLANSYSLAKEFISAFKDGLPDYVTNGELVEDVTVRIKDAVQFLTNGFEFIQEKLQPYINMLSEYVTSGQAAEDITKAVEMAVRFLYDSYEMAVEILEQVIQGFKDAVQWGKEHETTLSMVAIAVGTLTTAIVAYNVAQAIKNAGGVVEIAQLAATAVGVGALTVAEYAHAAATAVTTVATTAFGTALAFLTSPITLVVLAIGALIAIGVALYQNWDVISEKATELWNGITAKFEEIKKSVSEKIDAVKTDISEGISSAKEAVGNELEKIKEKFTSAFDSAKNTVKGAIEKIKGFFKFDWSLPKLKLPHPTITGQFSLNPPSVPKFSIEWYKKAMNSPMILDEPTIFGYDDVTGKYLGGGDAGKEVVSGANTLMKMIQLAVSEENSELIYYLQKIIEMLSIYFPQIIKSMDKDIVLNDGVLVGKLAPAMNKELGKISARKDRGR